MNRETLAALCLIVPLSVGGITLLSNTNLLASVNMWLGRPGAVEHRQAEALRPLIDCINRVDTPWRVAYDSYRNRSPRANDPSLEFIERFPERYRPSVGPQLSVLIQDTRRPDRCLLTSAQNAALQENLPHLVGFYQRYVETLLPVFDAMAQFDFYPSASAPMLSLSYRAKSDARFYPLATSLLQASAALRDTMDQADRTLRIEQLKQLQARGQEQQAIVPGLILQTRDTQQRLTPQTLDHAQLTGAVQALVAAWEKGEHDLRPARPDLDRVARQLWSRVRQPAHDYLQALQQLNLHSGESVDTPPLTADYFQAQLRYDLLVDAYNQAVGEHY